MSSSSSSRWYNVPITELARQASESLRTRWQGLRGTRAVANFARFVAKYDVNWWVRFLNIAKQEDGNAGETIGDPMAQHAWVNIAVSFLSRNLARAPFEIMNGEDIVETGPEYELFRNVNPILSRTQLWQATEAWLQAEGECIWLFEDGYRGGLPKELWPVDPRHFKHKLSPNKREITMWIWAPDEREIPFTPEELVHIHKWNPWDEWRGVSPCHAIGYEINQDHLASKSDLRMFRSGSVPDGILSSDEPIGEDEAKAVKKKWLAEHQGVNRSHTVAVLGYGMKYQPIIPSKVDQQYMELKKWNRQTVLAKYGLDARVVGASDDASSLSGKDTAEQMKAVWNNTLAPEAHFIEDYLQTNFFDRFLSRLEGRFNLDAIPELQEDEDTRWTRYLAAIRDGAMTINEAREAMRLEPVAWGDTWYKPFSLMPVDEELSPFGSRQPPPNQDEEPAKALVQIADMRTLFPVLKRSPYNDMYKTMHWWKVASAKTQLERDYLRDIRDWLFDQRSRHLRLLAATGKIAKVAPFEDWIDEVLEDGYWQDQTKQLQKISEKIFLLSLDISAEQLFAIFRQLGMAPIVSFDIYNTNAVTRINHRVTRGALAEVTDTVRNDLRKTLKAGMREGATEKEMAEGVRNVYNKAGNRAATIVRTELGGAINDSRVEGYKDVGFGYHSWVSSRDGKVRQPPDSEYNHLAPEAQGIIKIGEPFATGGRLLWPNHDEGAPGDIINCRCITLPEEGPL